MLRCNPADPAVKRHPEVEVERKHSAKVRACLVDQIAIRGALQQVAHMHRVMTAQGQKLDCLA